MKSPKIFATLVFVVVCLLVFAAPQPVRSEGPSLPATPQATQEPSPVVMIALPWDDPSIRIPPPRQFRAGRAPAATFSINYLSAGTPDGRGATCLAWDPSAQAAFSYAASIWATMIPSTVPIRINACWANLGSPTTLGYSWSNMTRDFTGAPQSGTWYSYSLADALAGRDLDPANPDTYITYNNGFAWYFGTDGQTPAGQYDFVSVVMHEMGHGLNFAGTMSYGLTACGNASYGCWGYSGYPGIYDRFIENGTPQALLNTGLFPNPSAALGTQLTSNNLYFNGPNANAANGGSRVKIYAPSTWAPGSSYSHLDYSTFAGTANRLMVYAISSASSIHDPGPVTMGLLKDLGWNKLNQTITVTTHAPATAAFNSTFTVSATASSGLPVAFSSAGSCTNSGSLFTMTSGTGTCTVRYDQAGNSSYNAAPRVTDSVTAQKANQTITVTTHAPATATFGTSFVVSARASSGLAVTFSSSGGCTNTGTRYTMTSGTTACVVRYDQVGNANYNAASQVTENVIAQKANTTTTLTSVPNPSTFGQSVTFTTTVAPSAANGTVQFYADGAMLGPVRTLTSGQATYITNTLSEGTHVITATYSGDTNYNSSISSNYSQTVNCANMIVANANDSGAGSLRQAIADVCAGGTIIFDATTFGVARTITLTAELVINKNLTIDSTGVVTPTISGNNNSRVFTIGSGNNVTLNRLNISNGNGSGGNGGGIYNYGTLTVTNSTFSSNNTGGSGGGIFNYYATLSVMNSTFSDNSATQSGGGISTYGTLSVMNSTFYTNSATNYYGGGIFTYQGTLTVTNSTVAGNSARWGGGIYNYSGTATIKNTIIPDSGTSGNCSGNAFASGSTNNLADDGTCGASFTNSSTILLGTPGNYGGGTPTIPLLPNSAAIDAGDAASCPAQDQRGVARPQGAPCDIGAFESQGFAFGNLTGTPQSTAPGTAFAQPLHLDVTNGFGEPVDGGQVIFTAPGGGASITVSPITATISSGAVSQTLTANGIAGGPYTVTASARGVATPANFVLTNSFRLYLPLIVR